MLSAVRGLTCRLGQTGVAGSPEQWPWITKRFEFAITVVVYPLGAASLNGNLDLGLHFGEHEAT